ncbi:MAG: hypothetical protein ABR976_19565, partial [Terracidiphilus sp.]
AENSKQERRSKRANGALTQTLKPHYIHFGKITARLMSWPFKTAASSRALSKLLLQVVPFQNCCFKLCPFKNCCFESCLFKAA